MIKIKHLRYTLIIFIVFFLQNCQLKEPLKTHGINYLENRYKTLEVNKTNSNDVIKTLGSPHSTSLKEDQIWFYFERTITRGEYLKLGKNILKDNNVLVLRFDKFGILVNKNFLDKSEMKKIKYTEATTENPVSKKSFINAFLSSVKEKRYGKRKF